MALRIQGEYGITVIKKMLDAGCWMLGRFLASIQHPASSIFLVCFIFSLHSPLIAQTSSLAESTRALYRGEPQRAGELAEKHLRKFPNDAQMRVILARAELAQGKFQRAYQELQRALQSNPRNIDALYYLAIVSRALSQEEYRRLYAMAPDSDRVHLLLGETALTEEKKSEAEAEFEAALKANPRSIEALLALGELKRSQMNFDDAITYYKQAERIGPLNYDIAYGLGACYTYKQEHQQAIEYLRQAVALAPDSAAGRFALGNALFQSEQTGAAIPELKAALEMEPQLKQAYFLLGRAYQKLNQPAEARAAFKKLDELNKAEAAGQGKKPPIEGSRGEAGSNPASSKGQRSPRRKP